MITKIAFVGQPTRDLERSKRFYGEVLGLAHDHDYGSPAQNGRSSSLSPKW